MALIIAGNRSGVGKTTITLAMLAYLVEQKHQVQSFKVGPDYIDPMFHRAVTSLPCRNLDPVITSPNYVRECFKRHAQNADQIIIEGVMGLFDGISSIDSKNLLNDYGSTAHIARILNLPVVLVLDCSGLSTSIAAIAYGYANLDSQIKVAGIILNKVASDRHLELLKTALNSINMPILGVLKRNTLITIPDRHLGLVPTAEVPGIKRIFTQLADLARTSFNWDKLLPLLNYHPSNSGEYAKQYPDSQLSLKESTPLSPLSFNPIRIAIAQDRAFNFYYQDNLDLLQELGAELVFWSPLKDHKIPQNIQGLYFGGGFPEVFAEQLAANLKVQQQLKRIIESGIPTYAECGGLMYLCQQLTDLKEQTWSMVGVIPNSVTMQSKLTLGYRKAIALQNSPLIQAHQSVKGHEFHRSQLTVPNPNPQWQLRGFHSFSPQFQEGWNIAQLHASYLHLHWGETKFLAHRFIQSCRNYQSSLY
ncbi:cobyrinate a,c-diamide synthase [Pleurocapsales cyanobacterium LEGE 10410]|nr:cobyrinate a,c-diamide synthase [Pleurocapsales cyanobacterium LEGE 10410]